MRSRVNDALAAARAWLPTGHSLTREEYARRHQWISVLLWLHVVAVPVYGIYRGQRAEHAVAEASVIGVIALAAGWRRLSHIAQSVMATLGRVTASGILTHFSGGLIEMHFHFFVVVAIIALYQSWVPFLAALGFVVAHHTIVGQLAPESVFNHEAALRSAWRWALVHGGFILAESAACLVAWRMNEIALDSERQAREEMEKAHSDLAAAQALSNIGSWDWNTVTGDVWWSQELYRIMGRDPATFVPGLDSFLSHVAESDRGRVSDLIAASASQGAALNFECTIVRPDSAKRIIHARGDHVAGADSASHILGTCQDITERKALEHEVEYRAFHDALTGLPNRALFLDRVEHALELSKRTGTSLALLFIDLDDFKTVNDNLGHGIGDGLLTQAAKRLRSTVRTSDTFARLGGDEFALLLENTTAEGASDVADKLLLALEDPVDVGDTRLLARASIGIAVADEIDDASDLLRHADIAMYTAKRQGKHQHRLFNEGMHSSLTARIAIEAELREAIAGDQLMLHYQPLVDLTTGNIEGVEALVRWDHPERGVLPPSEFIPIAEELGLIAALGSWVLRRATADLRTLQEALGRSLFVSVNVAAPQLHTDIVQTVAEALHNADLPAAHLLLEITESCLMSQEEAVVGKLTTLREMGVRIAIDDFGTGYSSLAYLRQLPIDHLKIDRTFVRDIAIDAEASGLAQSIIELGTLFGLRVVGEGIETADQAEVLRRLGCHAGQGYHYHRPTDLESLLAALAGVVPVSSRR